MKKLVSVILALAMLFSLAACGAKTEETPAQPKETALSPEKTSAEVGNVKIEMGDFVLDGEAELAVTKLPEEEDADAGCKVQAYDISVGDLHELGDYITIRIPYDDAFCDAGEDPAECVGAMYKNEQTGQWEEVLYEVDAGSKELVIYTDHLSVFGSFTFANAGKRSARITGALNGYFSEWDENAAFVMEEFLANGGEVGSKAVEYGIKQLQLGDAYAASGDAVAAAGGAVDLYSNLLTLATLGGPEFSGELTHAFHEGLGYAGVGLSAAALAYKAGQAAVDSFNGNATDNQIIALYKDTASLMMGIEVFSSLTLAGAVVFAFDQVLAQLMESGYSAKSEKINEVYRFFNDSFSGDINGKQFHARTLKDWRNVVIGIAEQNLGADETTAAIQKEIDDYCARFWTLDGVDIQFLQTYMEKGGTKGENEVPFDDPNIRSQLTNDYKAELNDYMKAIIPSVEQYYKRKMEEDCLKQMNAVRELLNQTITIEIAEDIPDGESARYAGYTLRFAPLSDGADKENWTGKLKEDGTAATKTTLIGFLLAGNPAQLQLFPPDANPDTDAPELTVGYVLSAPATEITITAGPPLSEVLGDYLDGVMTVREVYISEELKAAAAESADPENEYGCDVGMLAGMLQEQVDVPQENAFRVQGEGPDSGSLLLGIEGDEPSAMSFSYRAGALSVNGLLDGAAETSGDLKCAYTSDHSAISVSGLLKMSFPLEGFPPDSFYVMIELTGTKPIA